MLGLGWLPLWAVIPLLFLGMIGLGFALERGIFRPLIGQPVIAAIMVTIGLAFVLQGVAAILWKAGTRQLPLPVRVEPYIIGDVFISPINVVAAVTAVICLVGFGLFFTKSRMGIAMRAVADDQQAAMTVGINVRRISRCRGPSPASPPPPAGSSGATCWAWTPSSPSSASRCSPW